MIKLTLSLILIGIISFLSVLFYLNFRDKSFTKLQKTYSLSTLLTHKSGELMKGDIVTGKFRAVENNLGIIAIRFQTFDRINSDIFIFRIKEQGSSGWYYENEYESSKFGGYPLFPFGFPIIADSKGKDYYFELESLAGKPTEAVAIKTEEPVIVTTHKFTVNQLLSDKKVLFLFASQKAVDVLMNKQALQDFLFIYIILTSVLIMATSGKRLLRYVVKSTVWSKKKVLGALVLVEKFSLVIKALRFIREITLFTGRMIFKILSLSPKWLKKE